MNRISGYLRSAHDVRSIGRRCFVVAGQHDRATGRHHVLFTSPDSGSAVLPGASDYPHVIT